MFYLCDLLVVVENWKGLILAYLFIIFLLNIKSWFFTDFSKMLG